MRGILSALEYAAEIEVVRSSLNHVGLPHWQEFLAAWPAPENVKGELSC
jgi:hypothetical protein